MIKKTLLKQTAILTLGSLLTGCGLFDTDNTPKPSPLTSFTAEVQPHLLWTTNTGNGNRQAFLKLSPAVQHDTIYTADASGRVSAIDRAHGTVRWQISTDTPLTAGPGANDDVVVVGGEHGEIMARHVTDGSKAWERKVYGAVIANPVVLPQHVIVKSLDGHLYALSSKTGQRLWSTQQAEPNLILRGSSKPAASNGQLYVGFANGHLNRYQLASGSLTWSKAIATPEGAFAIERMVDIDANPKIFNGKLFAATYQGNLAALAPYTGGIHWKHKLSSYTGMDSDGQHLYVSDASGNVWSFNNDDGHVNWRQTVLKARGVSGPAVLGNYVIVGDAEGYLHWLDKSDGRLVAREHVSGGILASPIVKNGSLYAQTTSGNLYAYTLG